MSYPFLYKDSAGLAHSVYPAVYQGVLNFGLELTHYDHGLFLTEETVNQRRENLRRGLPETRDVRDSHPNLRTGMKNHVRVIKLRPGQPIFRFASSDNAHRQSGPWWTTKLGFEQMLLRTESSVVGGRRMTLREYARRYSAVAESWNRMDRVFMGVVQQPIRCFMGMGSKQFFFNVPQASAEKKRQQVHIHHGNVGESQQRLDWVRDGRQNQLNLEEYADENIQIYLPNLAGHIAPAAQGEQGFLGILREWTPEEIDHKLAKLARATVHAARRGVVNHRDARRQRLTEICRALGYEYQHQEEHAFVAFASST